MKLTRWGQRLTAVADSPDLAELYGISREAAYDIAIAHRRRPDHRRHAPARH